MLLVRIELGQQSLFGGSELLLGFVELSCSGLCPLVGRRWRGRFGRRCFRRRHGTSLCPAAGSPK
jgi:hypothetical protein